MADGDYDCSYRPTLDSINRQCREQSPYMLVRKLVMLMDNPMSKNQVSRHLTLLHDFLKTCSYAFWVRDLPYVIRLIEIVYERQKVLPQFRKPLEYLLAVCSTPPMMLRSSELLTCSQKVVHFFNLLGFLLCECEEVEIRYLVLHALHCILERKCEVGKCCLPLNAIIKGMEESEFPIILVSLLEFVDEDYYSKLLELANTIVNISTVSCVKMVNENIIDYIFLRLIKNWDVKKPTIIHEEDYLFNKLMNLSTATNILWPLLKAYSSIPKDQQIYKGPALNSLQNLCFALRILVKTKSVKSERNNMMSILLYCLELFPEMNFYGSGLAEDICILIGASELGTNGTWASQLWISTDEWDFKFKKILLIAIDFCLKHNIEMAIIQKQVTKALLRLLTPEMTIKWNKQHYCVLSVMSLTMLTEMVPKFTKEFLNNDGVSIIFKLLQMYLTNKYDIVLLNSTLQLAAKFLSLRDIKICKILNKSEWVHVIISICNNLLESFLNMKNQNSLKFSFICLHYIVEKTEIQNYEAIDFCMKYMVRDLNPSFKDVVKEPAVLICCLDFLWQLLIYSDENLIYFIHNNGIFILLDTIWGSTFPVKIIALGIVVDCCEEGSCISHLLTWRKFDISFIPMLLQVFREENTMLEVKLTEKFVIKDVENPLMGKKQFEFTYSNDRNLEGSPCLMDMLGSCRPKIYAILQLFQRHEERVSLINERYRISNSVYSIADEITLLLAENYLPLKLGEAWTELLHDICYLQNAIMGYDRKTLDIILNKVSCWSLHLKRLQETLLKKEKYQEIKLEKELYHYMKENQLSSSLDALHEMNYIARTTEKMFRFMKKMKHRIYLDELEVYTNTLAEYHTTFMYNINVSRVFNQKVKVESNKIIDPFGKPFDLRVVSPRDDVIETLSPTCDNTLSEDMLIKCCINSKEKL